MSDNIPYDIQAEIIKILPIKSLIRFRLVSKTWKSLINSSKFIVEYHTQRKHKHQLLVKYHAFGNLSDDHYVSILDDDTLPQHKFSLSVPTSDKLLHRQIIVISSQGLVFLHRRERYSGTTKALIWSPTIRKSVNIDMRGVFSPAYFGFGVCPDTCDPKIVKLPTRDTVSEVFTLSTNAWRKLSKRLPRKSNSFTRNQVAIDRFMYWLANETNNEDGGYHAGYTWNLIVSFDMTSEEFAEINLPDSLAVGLEERIEAISTIRESLVMVGIKIEAGKQVYSVWNMMEHAISKEFTKLYTIKTTDVMQHVHGFRKSGEPIVETKTNGQKDLFVYELDSTHLNYIGISGAQYFFSVTPYFETLLLLDQ